LDAALLAKHISAERYPLVAAQTSQVLIDIKAVSKWVKIDTVGDLRNAPEAFWKAIDPVLCGALKETFLPGMVVFYCYLS